MSISSRKTSASERHPGSRQLRALPRRGPRLRLGRVRGCSAADARDHQLHRGSRSRSATRTSSSTARTKSPVVSTPGVGWCCASACSSGRSVLACSSRTRSSPLGCCMTCSKRRRPQARSSDVCSEPSSRGWSSRSRTIRRSSITSLASASCATASRTRTPIRMRSSPRTRSPKSGNWHCYQRGNSTKPRSAQSSLITTPASRCSGELPETSPSSIVSPPSSTS